MTTKWALAPMEATPEMLEAAGTIAGWSGSIHMADVEHSDWYEDIVTASPGADLLERIVRARDRLHETNKNGASEACDIFTDMDELLKVLDELGGGDG